MSGSAAGLLQTVLGFVDRPWKAFAIAGLAIVFGSGYLIYVERADIAQAVLRNYITPRLLPEVFNHEAAAILEATQADVVQLFSMEMGANRMQFIAGFERGGAWHTFDLPEQIIHDTTQPALLLKLIEGEVLCLDLAADSPTEIGRADYAQGLRRRCIVTVPPVLDVTVGLLSVGWRLPLLPRAERARLGYLRESAKQMARW